MDLRTLIAIIACPLLPNCYDPRREEDQEVAREDGGGRSWRVEELEAAKTHLKLSEEPKVDVCTRGGGRSWGVEELEAAKTLLKLSEEPKVDVCTRGGGRSWGVEEIEAAKTLLKISEEPKVDVCTRTVSRDHVDIATGSGQKDSAGRRIPRSSGRRPRRKTNYRTLEYIYADPRSYLDSSG